MAETTNKHSTKTKDKNIRKALSATLLEELKQYQRESGHPTRIFSELGIEHGDNRIDIATINGVFHGYEIKSDSDTLERLPAQIKSYNKVFDKVTLVVGKNLLLPALDIIPEWWGIILAKYDSHNEIVLAHIREPRQNSSLDKLSLARLLWKEEALQTLHDANIKCNLKHCRREEIYKKLASSVSTDILQSAVKYTLINRPNWRSDQAPSQYDG